MKLCRLKLKNLNSFREEIDIDFEDPLLADASLVAITGPTGAGKTTLLDAICVTLYGKTPRLSGTGSQHPRHLISHGEKEGFAEVHFVANGTRYIASWSLRRRSSAEVRLSYAADNKLISDKLSGKGKALGSSQRTVSEEVESILGLDFDAFRRSVMLAQGEFAAFLKASKENRRTILEATAGIDIYEILKDTLNEKVKEVEAANADVLSEIERIPEAFPEQLTAAGTELERLKSEAKALETRSQEIQEEKDRETKRTEDYEKLRSSENRHEALLNEQQKINALQIELENAQRAERLRTEKQTYDTAKSDLEEAETTLNTTTTEKTDAENKVKADQADFDGKKAVYLAASTEHKRKTDVYRNAKLDVQRAADQFAEAEKRTTAVEDLDSQIDTLSQQLADKETEQIQLQEQIDEAQTFLDDNPLPSDMQHRLNRANVLLAQLDSQQTQLGTALTSEIEHGEKVSSLKRKIEKLSKTHAERLSKKTEAEDTLETATAELNKLLATGAREEWTDRKQQLAQAHPVVQRYEEMLEGMEDISERASELEKKQAELASELVDIEKELAHQEVVYRLAVERGERCEAERESALLADPINQLRQHLHTGEPCLVCGATEHPLADVVETESVELLQCTESALEHAKTKIQMAQDQMQALKIRQVQTQQDERNVSNQISEFAAEIEVFQDEAKSLQRQWKEVYLDLTISFDWIAEDSVNISSDWIVEQIEKADTAIAALAEARQAQTAASHAYDMVAQQLDTCETDIAREEESLKDVEKQLQDVNNTIADLQADVAATEKRFWEFLPETFHGVVPDTAVNQFSEKIDEVTRHKDKLDKAQAKLNLLNAEIKAERNGIETLRNNRGDLQGEIGEYRREGEAFLDAVREKTGGLETEDEIDDAIDELETQLQAKEAERDGARQQLQSSQQLLTQKQTAHEISEDQHQECGNKFETARDVYFNRLKDARFDSPEAHDDAFRDDVQMRELTDQIDAHEDEKQQLVLAITELKTRFEETPFDPEVLGRIETEAKEIAEQLQMAQQEVGAQQQKIDDLKDALEKRNALGDKIAAAEAELMRWKNLQDTIPANNLRDFALEIMFKQMGSLANEQLRYLTSNRYQLKVETIGDLSVIDCWNANEERPVETLSGGESFLTSLALALALADLSRGRAQLNSLFLDEGFGTLDAETLDTAIAALEGLRMQGRSIFLISHVQELTRRIPVKINVRKRGDGSSSVQVPD